MIASLGAALLLCLNFSVVSYADTVVPFENDGISLAYEIADNCTAYLEIVNRVAHCTSIAEGTDAVSITVTQTLQKHWGLWIWEDVDGATWTGTANIGSICLYNTKSGLKSGKYRVKSTFVLTDANGKSETISIYSNEQLV
ncbi:MAG: hypothetical protein NC299_13895 [Lachnospiraceae bacterium]|nr:hypothetical protein [Lachnospiraceae bacterium]